jgi:probable rRNA maturation factor
MPTYRIQIADRQDSVQCDETVLRRVLEEVLRQEGDLEKVDLSVALVGDEETCEVNASFLDREGVTDVIAFPYEGGEDHLEGEIVLNADEAVRQARRAEHEPWDELLLYAVHGMLHLLGYEDSTPELRNRMNERAAQLLQATGRTLDTRTLLEE